MWLYYTKISPWATLGFNRVLHNEIVNKLQEILFAMHMGILLLLFDATWLDENIYPVLCNETFKQLYISHSESSSDLVEGTYGNTNSRLIYGVFSTPNNAIAGSAICAFSLQVKYIYFSSDNCILSYSISAILQVLFFLLV